LVQQIQPLASTATSPSRLDEGVVETDFPVFIDNDTLSSWSWRSTRLSSVVWPLPRNRDHDTGSRSADLSFSKRLIGAPHFNGHIFAAGQQPSGGEHAKIFFKAGSMGTIWEGTMDDEVRDEEQKGGMAATDRRTLLRTAGLAARQGGARRARCIGKFSLARSPQRSAGGHLDAKGSTSHGGPRNGADTSPRITT